MADKSAKRHLSDEQIAAHEAGDALVCHLIGETIQAVDRYTDPQPAKVTFAVAVQAEQVWLARSAGEFIAGFEAPPPDGWSDMESFERISLRLSGRNALADRLGLDNQQRPTAPRTQTDTPQPNTVC